ncbi:hypothetical protein CARUB_v10028200mg [Capsella rubella]|uniref:ADP-ribosyl cyclase/cyclic ADP-ribose hydrolase n=1 Tax=Capsella rubella TaxID=81985 RepID=R0GDT4_9BRAS|nr:hypothetical protein CARUB_v10028200mg [Capsella rubella]
MSSRNWQYDVFLSFRGEDVRHNFVSHFLKELGRKMITTFEDTKIEKGESLDPVLKKTIKDSRIAVVLFSKNYASSSWCLNELLEIVQCHKDIDQVVIPIFYGVDPSHVRHQTGDFGTIFKETCKKNTEDLQNQWKLALTKVANLVGICVMDSDDEAKHIEVIANDLLGRLKTPSEDYESFVGIQDHITKLRSMLDLESPPILFNQLSPHFGGRIYIDKHLISREDYNKTNLTDYNTRMKLQQSFLSILLDKEGIMLNHLGAVKEKLKHQNVLIFFDDLDNQMVLDVLAGGDEWFGPGSRIIAITKDKQILRAHGIKCVYEVGIPSEKVAFQIFCQSAFKQVTPPDEYKEFASEVAMRAGGLPLGLNLLGSSLRGRDPEYWEKMLLTVKNLDGKIEQALRVSYDALERDEHKRIFRHIACFFNGAEVSYIKLMLADVGYDINIGLDILIDKSLIHVIKSRNKSIVEMHCLLEEMGKEVVRSQSSNKPGKREFLIGSEDVCNVLAAKTDTQNVLGISLNLNEIDELEIHKKAFKNMRNLRFLKFYTNSWEGVKEVKWILPDEFDEFPTKLKLLSWPGYPLKQLPATFCPEKLVELRLPNSKILEKLWKGNKSLECLKDMDLSESQNLKEIPNLSKATNLETLDLHGCIKLVELPSSILSLNKLKDLNMAGCTKLKAFPTGDLKSLTCLNLAGCSALKTFPVISNQISELILDKTSFINMKNIMSERLWEGVQPLTKLKKIVLGSENLKEIPDLSMATRLETLNLNGCSSLVELTLSSIQNLNNLKILEMLGCSSLETLPTNINLKSLYRLNLNGCSRLKSFPNISSKISILYLNQTAVEEVPPWIDNFSSLEALEMRGCTKLKCISPRIFQLENLDEVFFSECEPLVDVIWPEKEEDTNITRTDFKVISFTNCFNLNQENIIQRSASKCLILPGEVPPYFTHQSPGSCFIIPLHQSPLSQQPFLDFKACVAVSDLVVASKSSNTVDPTTCFVDIEVRFRYIDKQGNYSEPTTQEEFCFHQKYNHLIIFDCHIPLSKESEKIEIKISSP